MRGHRFTIYDALEKSGYFDANPANPFARDPTNGSSLYNGPVSYPKMLYHPEGEEKIIVPAEIITTPLGPKAVGEQRELINMTVANAEEEAKAVAEGWWDHPAKAVRRRVELLIEASPGMTEKEKAKIMATVPEIANHSQIKYLEEEIRRLKALAEDTGALPQRQSGPLQPVAAANSLGARFGDKPLAPASEL